MSKTLFLAIYNALTDCLFVRIIIHYDLFFVMHCSQALLALLICPFVIIFILYWVETTQCAVLVQICRKSISVLRRGTMRSYLFLENITVIDKNHNRTGPGQIYGKYILAA